MDNFVVTFARGFGTGGKEIASKLAAELGIHCYENRILTLASQMTGLDEKTALAISAGFGGGRRSGEVCGAISGAVMAAGMAYPFTDGSDVEAKQKIAELANKCVAAAAEKYGKVRCAELKGNIDCNEIICFMAETAEKIIKE